jgi:conjugation system TraG family ATPase
MAKAISLFDVFPIYNIESDCILSRQGDVTVAFEVQLPELFCLSDQEYETLHQVFIKAIKVLTPQTVFHKQDWFYAKTHQGQFDKNGLSFLSRASERHFHNRPYLEHLCYIMLTHKSSLRKASSSLQSNLLRKYLAPTETVELGQLQSFFDSVGQFQRILSDSGYVKLRRMRSDDLAGTVGEAGLLERYCSLSTAEQPVIRDIHLKDGIKIGDQYCEIFSLADVEDLPALCGSRINYDRYSTDKTKFSVGFASSLGQLLPCNHIYNQFIIIEDIQKTIKKLESKRLRLQSLSAYSRENAISRDATNEFLNELISSQRLPVKAHYNVMIWTDNLAELKELKTQVSSALAQMDATPKQESDGAAQIFWSGLPGNAADFPSNDMFDTFAEQAACFLNVESNYRSDPPATGIRFCDRLSARPVYVDLFDAPRRLGITSNMGMLVAGSSGGGKSMTVNHILRSLCDHQDAHCVIVDIGGSYRGLCELLGGYYFTYDEKDPIRFNPFYIAEGDVLDTEKKESLKSLLVALWKQENENFNRSEYVALSNALQGYFHYLSKNESIFPCFDSFYEYLQGHYVNVLKDQNVKDKDFDINNFLYVLRPYYQGGEFDYLLNGKDKLDILNQPFVVFELDNVKDHPILFPVITLIIMESFISKMRKLAGKRKVLAIDEAWKAIAKSGMAEFLKYAFKTIRKFNGIPIVITQEIDDLISSPIVKDAIINNADIKILMDMRKFMNKFDQLQQTLGLSEKGKTLLLSVNKDSREVYIDLGGQVMKVYKNELCPEEYYAFTTEGKERVKVREYAARFGSIEKGITALVAETKAA